MPVRQHCLALTRAHRIPQMENRQVHCHHQRADDDPCHNQKHWLEKCRQIICPLKGLFRMVPGEIFQHDVQRT